MPDKPHPRPNGNKNETITLTTGPVWRHPDTQFVVVSILNESDEPQEVTISILDWTTCDHPDYGKFAFTCGGAPSQDEESSDDSSSSSDDTTSTDTTVVSNKLIRSRATHCQTQHVVILYLTQNVRRHKCLHHIRLL